MKERSLDYEEERNNTENKNKGKRIYFISPLEFSRLFDGASINYNCLMMFQMYVGKIVK